MEHFVAYHKVAEYGPYQGDARFFSHYSKKTRSELERTIGQTLWVISGERIDGQMEYRLEAVFTPSAVEDADDGFTVDGPGKAFLPPPKLNGFGWFSELLRDQGNFAFGIKRFYIPEAIAWLLALADGDLALPEELPTSASYIEGAVRRIEVNAYERDSAAKLACKAHYGTACAVCEFDFAEFYGELGDRYIHVHHLRDLATIGREYQVDPIADLRPVCPNCHAMLHRGTTPARSIEQLKEIIEEQRNRS